MNTVAARRLVSKPSNNNLSLARAQLYRLTPRERLKDHIVTWSMAAASAVIVGIPIAGILRSVGLWFW